MIEAGFEVEVEVRLAGDQLDESRVVNPGVGREAEGPQHPPVAATDGKHRLQHAPGHRRRPRHTLGELVPDPDGAVWPDQRAEVLYLALPQSSQVQGRGGGDRPGLQQPESAHGEGPFNVARLSEQGFHLEGQCSQVAELIGRQARGGSFGHDGLVKHPSALTVDAEPVGGCPAHNCRAQTPAAATASDRPDSSPGSRVEAAPATLGVDGLLNWGSPPSAVSGRPADTCERVRPRPTAARLRWPRPVRRARGRPTGTGRRRPRRPRPRPRPRPTTAQPPPRRRGPDTPPRWPRSSAAAVSWTRGSPAAPAGQPQHPAEVDGLGPEAAPVRVRDRAQVVNVGHRRSLRWSPMVRDIYRPPGRCGRWPGSDWRARRAAGRPPSIASYRHTTPPVVASSLTSSPSWVTTNIASPLTIGLGDHPLAERRLPDAAVALPQALAQAVAAGDVDVFALADRRSVQAGCQGHLPSGGCPGRSSSTRRPRPAGRRRGRACRCSGRRTVARRRTTAPR